MVYIRNRIWWGFNLSEKYDFDKMHNNSFFSLLYITEPEEAQTGKVSIFGLGADPAAAAAADAKEQTDIPIGIPCKNLS